MKRLKVLLSGAALMLGLSTAAQATPTFPDGFVYNDSSLWSLSNSTTSAFTLYFEKANYQSDFGLFNVDDPLNPTAMKGDIFQIFSYDQTPSSSATLNFRFNNDHWEARLNDASPWKDFDPTFGFYFGVHIYPVSYLDYKYYSFAGQNNVDAGIPHIAVGYNKDNQTALIYLEDEPYAGSDLDYDDMRIQVTDVVPVPEPGTMILLGAGFLGLAIYGKRRRNARL